MAVVAAIQKAGGTDTEKLIAAMEGMEFQTPKGKMIFRKEDHQALQSMYVFKMTSKPDVAWLVPTLDARALAAGDGAAHPEQEVGAPCRASRRDGVSLAVHGVAGHGPGHRVHPRAHGQSRLLGEHGRHLWRPGTG